MIGLYHSADLDGHCCGAILRRKFGDAIELIGLDYGDPFPWEKVKGQEVIMADFSIQPGEEMLRLERETSRLVWIDHHKSAMEDAVEKGYDKIDGIRMEGQAACELLWDWSFPTEQIPESVTLLGRYDVWDLSSDSDILPFQYGVRLYEDTSPDSHIWRRLFVPGRSQVVISAGQTVIQFQRSHNRKYQMACAFKTELDGLKMLACNVGLVNSQAFDCWNEEDYDVFAPFYWKKGQWAISLYSEKVDVSEIAKKRGGGGHRGAAGFQCKELPDGFLR